MPREGFQTAIPMFERPKTVLALDRAAIETGTLLNYRRKWFRATKFHINPRTGRSVQPPPPPRPGKVHNSSKYFVNFFNVSVYTSLLSETNRKTLLNIINNSGNWFSVPRLIRILTKGMQNTFVGFGFFCGNYCRIEKKYMSIRTDN
jgi:hypothetical protein